MLVTPLGSSDACRVFVALLGSSDACRVFVALLGSSDACRVAGPGLAPRVRSGALRAGLQCRPLVRPFGLPTSPLARPRKSRRPDPATRPAAVFRDCCAAGRVWVLGVLLWCLLPPEQVLR